MAKNSGKKFNAKLQEIMEKEGMIRRLKEAGLYDHNETYEKHKQLDEFLEQSKVEARRNQKSDQVKDLPSEKRVTSFEEDFNIVDDDDLKEIDQKDTSSSIQPSGRKQPEWKELSQDEDDENFQTKWKTESASRVATKPFQKNASKLQKAKPLSIDSKKLVQTPVESYGNKMVAASIKKSEDNPASPNSSRLLNSRRGELLLSPDEIAEMISENKSDTEDDDFVAGTPPRPKENISRTKTEQSNPGQKQKFAAIRALCKKYSEMLVQIENVPAFPLPENPDFDSKEACYQLLIENEERMKASQSSNYKPIKWRKPIILSATTSRKRRPIFNQPSTSRSTPPKDTQEDSVDAIEIVCDSPPAASTKKLDTSPPSPIFESSASRKRSGGSNGITETEMEVDRKSPIFTKEDSATQECPICGKFFPLSVIEGHADGCINNIEERPRSERIARNARSNKSYNAWSDNSQWGRGFDRAAGTSIVSETIDPDVLFETETEGSKSDSDFEPDLGTKRSQRKPDSVGVKKRRL